MRVPDRHLAPCDKQKAACFCHAEDMRTVKMMFGKLLMRGVYISFTCIGKEWRLQVCFTLKFDVNSVSKGKK